MKKKIGMVLLGFCLVGCVGALTPEQTEKLQSADARIEKLAGKYPEVAAELVAIREDVKAAEVTPTQLAVFGVTGGVLGRSILHFGSTFGGAIPGVGPLLAGLCSLLLAGSKGNRKKEPGNI